MALKLQETGREFSQTRSDICANGSVIDDIVISFALGHENFDVNISDISNIINESSNSKPLRNDGLVCENINNETYHLNVLRVLSQAILKFAYLPKQFMLSMSYVKGQNRKLMIESNYMPIASGVVRSKITEILLSSRSIDYR